MFIPIRDAKKSLIKTNNIISKINSLSNEFKQLSPNDNIYIFSNLLENSPYGNFNEIDENIFHIAFVKAVSNKLIPVFVHSHHIHQHEVDEKFGIKRPINIDHIVCF